MKSLTTTFKLVLSVVLSVGLIAAPAPIAFSQSMGSHFEEVQILKGDLHALSVTGLTRASITDPSVADISDATEDEVLLLAQSSGQTVLFVWEGDVKRTILIRVVDQDLSLVKARVNHLLRKAEIYGVFLEESPYEGRVILTGELSEDDLDKLDEVVAPFDEHIINLTKQRAIEDMIEIEIEITELSQTLESILGFGWNNKLDYSENLPGDLDGLKDFFKVGDINRTTQLVATINALKTEGKARTLSKPKLVVANGKEASFLVGGEIPIRTTTANATGGSVQEDVDFKEYGINMIVTPTIRNGKIDMLVNLEVTDIDLATAQKIQSGLAGDSSEDVAFTSREAQTQLYLNDGQQIVLAGLIKRNESETYSGVPGLSKIPVLGMLFRNKSESIPTDVELVISIKPRILKEFPSQSQEMERALNVKQDQMDNAAYSEAMNMVEKAKVESTDLITNINSDIRNLTTVTTNSTVNVNGPTITKNPMNVKVQMPASVGPYAHEIQRRISQSISYPYEAQKFGWQGTVKLDLRILKDGTLKDIVLKETSGHSVFDQDAVNTAQILAPYSPLPMSLGLDELVVTVPIVYNIAADNS